MSDVRAPERPATEVAAGGDSVSAEQEAASMARRASGLAIGAWVILLFAVNRWGEAILDLGLRLRILAPPIIGRYRLNLTWKIVIPVAVGAALVWWGPRLAARLSWRRLLLASWAGAVAWACAVALIYGWFWLQRPMELPGHYLLDVPVVGSPGRFLDSFVAELDRLGVHGRAHPPGFTLVLWALDSLGMKGSGWAAALVIAVGASAVPAVLVAARDLMDESAARRMAPFLVLAPLALYVATTADAFFAGVGAWAATAVIVASGRPGRQGDVLAAAGGLLFGVTLMLSYGLALLAAVPLGACILRRRVRPVIVASAVGSAFLVLFLAWGFWWLEGLFASRLEYSQHSVARVRPLEYFAVANVAILGLLIGPAGIAGLVRLRGRRAWALVGGALAALLVADVSGFSKGEVERIWLPFAFWIVPAAVALTVPGRQVPRSWLAAQAALAVAVQVTIRTHW